MGALSEEQLALVEAFVKEAHDYMRANLINAYLMKEGTLEAVAGDNAVAFTADGVDLTRATPYDNTNYLIDVIEAVDSNGYDVRGELEIPDETKTVNGFVINCINPCTIKWRTGRMIPKIDFNT